MVRNFQVLFFILLILKLKSCHASTLAPLFWLKIKLLIAVWKTELLLKESGINLGTCSPANTFLAVHKHEQGECQSLWSKTRGLIQIPRTRLNHTTSEDWKQSGFLCHIFTLFNFKLKTYNNESTSDSLKCCSSIWCQKQHKEE